jgi:3-hydroxy-3-methylglutaryl CoA synthase
MAGTSPATTVERLVGLGAVAVLVGNEGGVVSGVINLESSGVEASDWRPRHDEHYHEA